MQQNKDWWKSTTIYQIYPRSFKDSNSDGIGDLQGIIEKLDYVKDLGFETIWFSPFFSSPQRDFGYDVSDYRSIAPEYGTLADVERLIAEIHKRDMKVVFDLIMNHTSDQHSWFIESSSSRDNPKSDWYIWRDGRGSNRPPNNWKALPGGSGWHYHPDRDQWYYASFLPFQPDLNFRNPEVKKEMLDTAIFWLDKGVDGFRLDIFHVIYKAEHFEDNPYHWSYIPRDEKYGFFTEWKYTVNQPETIELAHEMRSMMDNHKPGHFMLGEIFGDDETFKKYLGDGTNGMHVMFQWDLMDFKFDAAFIWDVLNKYEKLYPQPYSPVLVFGNHDKRRYIDRLNGDSDKAKLIALLQLTARGIPVVYYGEEIGLPEGSIPARDALDPVGKRYAWAPNWLMKALEIYVNRDNCRTPMAWDDTLHAGFTAEGGDPWLPLSAGSDLVNPADQINQADSLLNWYKDLLSLRSSSPSLQTGQLKLESKAITNQGLLAYTREAENEQKRVLINFSDKTQSFQGRFEKILLETGSIKLEDDNVILGAYAGIIFG